MARPRLEVADVFRRHGEAYLAAHAGRLSLGQLKVVSAIRACRTAALGGHVARCDGCGHVEIGYNSCRNRHCPKCQGFAARAWLDKRQADLLPLAYYHVVFTLPAAIAAIAFQNKAALYDLLMKTAAETLTTIAVDPKRLGVRIGFTSVLHTWGSALTHHPHVHIIVPGGGLSPDGERWIACKPGFFLPVRVLSRFFRRRFLEGLLALHEGGRLTFFGDLAGLANPGVFRARLAPLRRAEWVIYAKRPFGGPQAVLAYLSRYTHRVAISDSRIVAFDGHRVSFRWKDYRARASAPGAWIKTMTLPVDEFMRRFLLHVLPDGFHRIRHYGFLAGAARVKNVARIRQMIADVSGAPQARQNVGEPHAEPAEAGVDDEREESFPCRCCGGRMTIVERFARGGAPQTSFAAGWSDTS
ncbi:MAG: IS91 family transposase [Beijerinckiaceae bacterium]